MTTIDKKALMEQFTAKVQSEYQNQYLYSNASPISTGGYVHVHSTAYPQTTTFPQVWPVTSSFDPNAARIAALEEKIAKLEAEKASLCGEVAQLAAAFRQLDEIVADLSAKARKKADAEADEKARNSAGGILGRAISRHW